MSEYQFEFSNNVIVKICTGVVLMFLLLNLILPCFGKIFRYRYHQNLTYRYLSDMFKGTKKSIIGLKWLNQQSQQLQIESFQFESRFLRGIIHLVRMQDFPKNLYFLPPDTHMCVCVSGGKKCKFFGKFCVRTT